MKKLFTFFAAAIFAMTVNASTVTWNSSQLYDIWAFSDDDDEAYFENNTVEGITVTAVRTEGGAVGFAFNMIWFEMTGGTITFTSSIGNITKIEITGPVQYGKYNPETEKDDYLDNIEGSVVGDSWTFELRNKRKDTVMIWEGTPAVSVDISAVNFVFNEISSIVFTIEDAAPGKDFEIDFRSAVLGESNEKYLIINSDDAEYFVDDKPAAFNAHFTATALNGDASHGYVNLKADIPVEAGNYKLTLGTCRWGSSATITYGSENLNLNQQAGTCYHEDGNVVSKTFSVSEIDTIHVTCGNYTPYFKFEKLLATEYTITYAKPDGVDGTVPATQFVVDGEQFTVPVNRTLYKEGKTLVEWSDGANTYKPGAKITPEGDMNLTAVFEDNAFSLLTITEQVIVKWEFAQSKGAPSMLLEGSDGFLMTQATLGEDFIDVKLTIKATSGKFQTRSGDALVNAGTSFSFVNRADATVELGAYNSPSADKVDMQAPTAVTGAATDYVATFASYPNFNDESRLSTIENNYYYYIQVTYPKVGGSSTAIDQVENGKCENEKLIRNGQVLINRNGVLYTLTGQEVK